MHGETVKYVDEVCLEMVLFSKDCFILNGVQSRINIQVLFCVHLLFFVD